MTDLLHVIPDFPIKSYTHLLPSLEKHLVTTADLLTLDALEIAKRAQVPLLDLRRLANHVIAILHRDLGFESPEIVSAPDAQKKQHSGQSPLKHTGAGLIRPWKFITTLDPSLDAALGGGIPPRYLTEIVGESGAGKTQLLLSLLLTSQLPPPQGLSRAAVYISTEAPLPTSRLTQILTSHPVLRAHSSPPTLSQILGIQTPDLEAQEHIITYQLPIAVARYNVGLVVIDSIAANYRAEHSGPNAPAALAERSGQLSKLGSQLRNLARQYDCAIVVANQVSDRFAPVTIVSPSSAPKSIIATSSPHQPSIFGSQQQPVAFDPLTLDHQIRFFSGWGSDPNGTQHNLKTPSLGLVWANQIACRIVLSKQECESGRIKHSVSCDTSEGMRADWTPRSWRRWFSIAFAAWAEATAEHEEGVEFEIWSGGIKSIGL
ncbi:MAG: hypothetical protein Q9191_000849 [Dirinaria sp. TL-2023a]